MMDEENSKVTLAMKILMVAGLPTIVQNFL